MSGIDNYLEVSPGISLWFKTWGNKESGIPVLFVHGGPGACCADYEKINERFFDKDLYYVIEVDQRGTGKSVPSVRKDYQHMKKYLDISISQMSYDFELIREHLNIKEWLVFGGSWGSTLGLDYASKFSDVCLGLILRGIFLSTKDEHDAIYARKTFVGNSRRLKEFDTFFELASSFAEENNETPLDVDDSRRLVEIYEKMILNGNRDAIWRFYVWENNLMEEDDENLLDPYTVPNDDKFREACSISFFEARLFLKGTFEDPIDLLGDQILGLKHVPTWVCQGTGDEVCPEIYAQKLCSRLDEVGVSHIDHFVDSGHKASSGGMTEALILSVKEYYEQYGQYFGSSSGEKKEVVKEEEEEEEEEEEDELFGDLDALRESAALDGVGMPDA
jgi:proline iminopeptidase